MDNVNKIFEETVYSDCTKSKWMQDMMDAEPEADVTVLRFIAGLLYYDEKSIKSKEAIETLFPNGYCYYFACMLKSTFNRGEICWAAPFGHIVWMDANGLVYDIHGIPDTGAEYFIPIYYLCDAILDFKHVDGLKFNASEEFLQSGIDTYLWDMCTAKSPDSNMLRFKRLFIFDRTRRIASLKRYIEKGEHPGTHYNPIINLINDYNKDIEKANATLEG